MVSIEFASYAELDHKLIRKPRVTFYSTFYPKFRFNIILKYGDICLENDNKGTLVDKWIARIKNHPISASVVLGSFVIAGISSTAVSFKELVSLLSPQSQTAENLSANFLDPSPISPRSIQVIFRNSGSEAVAIQHVVFNVSINTKSVVQNGTAVFFPSTDSMAIPGKTSEILSFNPAAQGMFLPSEPTNPEFVEFFKNLGNTPGLNADHFRRRWMEKATCDMSIKVKFASGGQNDIFPEVNCIQLWPLVQAEFGKAVLN